MNHVRPVSQPIPVKSQYETTLQLLGVISAILALFAQVTAMFGIPLPNFSEMKTPNS